MTMYRLEHGRYTFSDHGEWDHVMAALCAGATE